VVATRAIRAGEVLTRDMLTVKRPCDGTMPAADLAVIVGQRCLVDVGVDEPLAVDAAPMDLPGRVSVAEVEPAG
ncbi:MAG: SAF domain-containing protein, partial [Planctomycetota bacterium]